MAKPHPLRAERAPARADRSPPEARVAIGATESDASLVGRALDGDAWAREALFRRYIGPLTRLVTRLMGRRQDADDVVQEACAEAFRELGRLQDPGAFRPWLYRIAVNRAKKTYRRRRLVRILGLDRGLDDATLAICADASFSPEARAELALVDEALRRLPTEQRIAWILRHVEGESLEQVAELGGCSLATAKRRIEAAQVALRGHWERRSP